MSTFTKFSAEPQIQYAREESIELGRNLWRVTEAFRYDIGSKNSGSYVTVPRGYLTDGASVPRIAWSIIPPWGPYGAAAIVHDILCEYLTVIYNGMPTKISRERADEILAEAMEVLGVSKRERNLISDAVNIYRRTKRIDDVVWHKDKAELEAKWVADNPKGG